MVHYTFRGNGSVVSSASLTGGWSPAKTGGEGRVRRKARLFCFAAQPTKAAAFFLVMRLNPLQRLAATYRIAWDAGLAAFALVLFIVATAYDARSEMFSLSVRERALIDDHIEANPDNVFVNLDIRDVERIVDGAISGSETYHGPQSVIKFLRPLRTLVIESEAGAEHFGLLDEWVRGTKEVLGDIVPFEDDMSKQGPLWVMLVDDNIIESAFDKYRPYFEQIIPANNHELIDQMPEFYRGRPDCFTYVSVFEDGHPAVVLTFVEASNDSQFVTECLAKEMVAFLGFYAASADPDLAFDVVSEPFVWTLRDYLYVRALYSEEVTFGMGRSDLRRAVSRFVLGKGAVGDE